MIARPASKCQGLLFVFFLGTNPMVCPDLDSGNSAVNKIDKTHGVDMQIKETSGIREISKLECVRRW